MLQRQAQTSKPAERFVELFQEVFGPAAAAKLEAEVYFRDISGKDRYIDFAIDSLLDRYAIEIDGETYHHPRVLTSEDYEDQLLRQNSLIHQGWRVLRWTDRQLAERPDDVKEHLAILLDQAIRLTVPQEYLPCKRASLIELHGHQTEALVSLERMRGEGSAIALLSHAVGTGKTTTAAEDARKMGLRTLFLAHTQELVEQALARFAELWPEASRARLGEAGDNQAQVVVGTVQYMSGNLKQYEPAQFGYIVIDEAHHATSKTYRAVLRYFDPEFLLGLTGTPERADGQNALEVFQQAAHRMDMETAVKSGILCDVRCFRVQTNIDLRRLKFNGSMYNYKDLEDKVSIPSRNQLIVDTYAANVPNRPAVVFCVSVDHAEAMAQLFTGAGYPARAVSGRLNKDTRQAILKQYERGEIKLLCACDVLNEGWDAPQTEVLLMARPTLSKVIYQQQIGRGMRTYPGKQYLVLFDFVDMFGRHNASLNIHRLTQRDKYRPGDRIFEPENNSDIVELPLHLWAQNYVPVDVFDWQQTVEGMITLSALSKLLRRSPEWVSDQYRVHKLKDTFKADEVIELSEDREIPYFALGSVPQIRKDLGIDPPDDDDIYKEFVRFVQDMDMNASYKPVWLLSVLKCVDEQGRASVADVTAAFWNFYRERKQAGQAAERDSSQLSQPDACSLAAVQQTINRGPYFRFSHLDYIAYANDKAYYRINKDVWSELSQPAERQRIEAFCLQAIASYYQRQTLNVNRAEGE